jgi:hypothetical protein
VGADASTALTRRILTAVSAIARYEAAFLILLRLGPTVLNRGQFDEIAGKG